MSVPIRPNPLGINKNDNVPLTLTSTQANSTVKLAKIGSPVVSGLQYNVNNNGWQQYTINTTISLDNIGDYVQFKNTLEELGQSLNDYVQFVMTGSISASGNMQSMLNFIDETKPFCFVGVFRNCTCLVSAPELPSISLANSCYQNMFVACTSLTKAPALPATKMAHSCYGAMFIDCISLVDIPELPSTNLASICYSAMFRNCRSLIVAPDLPAENLATYCYNEMFRGCVRLQKAPELPATTLAPFCYQGMFSECASLTEAPELPATTLADSCYVNMFVLCTSLTEAPELPATTLASYCYGAMFSACSSLVNAPELPATTLADNCYGHMFNACSSLTTAPELLATTLAPYCYQGMFSECASLTKAPELPASVLKEYCYGNLFENNESIQKIDVNFESWSNSTEEWTKYIYQDGVFLKPENLSEEYGYSKIPVNFTPFDKDKPLTLTAVEISTVKITKNGNPTAFNLLYKKNNGEWTQYSLDTIIDLNEGDFVQFKNITTNQFSTGNNDYYNFVMTGEIKASGNVQSLVNFSNTADWYAFRKLFQNCGSLIEAPTVLPAKHVSGYAYASMFGKTSITNMPIMLAEDFGEEACYYMFEECPIKYAKILDKKGLNGVSCFERMFNNCTLLNVIEVDFTEWDTVNGNNEHKDWCSGIDSSGTFLKKPELTKTFDNNRIKPSWNVYNPLKFIQASGTQYVNTGIIPSGNFEVEVCCTGVLNFGCRTDMLQNEFRFSMGINQIDFAFGNDLYSYSKTGIGNEKNIIRYGTDGKFYVNNELVYSSQSSVSQYYSLYAFALNSNGTPIYNGAYPSRIFRIKMWRDGVLVSDIIPVDADGGHLFDRFNNTCLPNSGTGDFVI